MNDEEYKLTLQENPELLWHPEYMNSSENPSRDFVYTPAVAPEPSGSSEASSQGR